MPKRKRLYLIDGSALAYRSYFAFIRNPLINSKGENTSAVFGFTNSIFKILRKERPDYIAVVFDTKAPTFRHEIFKDYKSTRAKMPDEMSEQLPRIREVVEGMNLPILEVDGFEADDLMGTLAKKAKKEGMEVILVTGDKDFLQLVDEDVKVLNPRRAGEEPELLDRSRVEEKLGVPPEKVIELLGLMGDASDNVPGVPGVGEKTALELLKRFGSLEGVLKNADKVKRKNVQKGLKEHVDLARLSKRLVTIDTDVPFELELSELERKDFDIPRLTELFKELEFTRFLQEIGPLEEEEKVSYRIIKSEKELRTLVSQLKEAGEFALDTETTSLNPIDAELVGISLSHKEKEAFYVPVAHTDRKGNLDRKLVTKSLKGLLEDEKIRKVGHNLKYDLQVFRQFGIELKGIYFDTMVASYLLNPSSRQHGLDNLALEHLDHRMIPISDLIGRGKKQKSFAEAPVKDACKYSCEDVDFTLRLKEIFSPKLSQLALEKLFFEVELPLIEVLAEMEMVGVSIDTAYLGNLSKEMEKRLEDLSSQIYDLAGRRFNINSPQQLSQILFEDLKLPSVRRTAKRTGYSTDIGVLETLAKEHPLPAVLLEYRQLAKLTSTYIDALPKLVNKRTKRIHTSFNQTVTATGRLSSSEPNLQNIPIRTDLGRQIRKAFIPRNKNFLIMSADYSQVELRILAHFSQDQTLMNSFKKGEDIHNRTASEVFGVRIDRVTSEQRAVAKTTNFAIIYGVSAYGLSQQTDMTPQEAAMFIDVYFKRYPRVKEYIDQMIELAREQSFVTTLLGRRRYIPEINGSNRQKREFAERTAINTPIQGSAADLIKVVMIDIEKELKKRKSKMILQVHDELVFEAHKDELDEVREMVRDKMENTVDLEVPIKVDINVGENWLEAK
ncbi:MAG: DNA polymerase I [Candidatus Zixiibacteriota bacterium]